jgi:hypothetical protein
MANRSTASLAELARPDLAHRRVRRLEEQPYHQCGHDRCRRRSQCEVRHQNRCQPRRKVPFLAVPGTAAGLSGGIC